MADYSAVEKESTMELKMADWKVAQKVELLAVAMAVLTVENLALTMVESKVVHLDDPRAASKAVDLVAWWGYRWADPRADSTDMMLVDSMAEHSAGC